MNSNSRKNYFLAIRMVLMLGFSLYGMTIRMEEAGVSATMLLLLALFIGFIACKELVEGWKKAALLLMGTGVAVLINLLGGDAYFLLLYFIVFEILSFLRARFEIAPFFYVFPFLMIARQTPMELSERGIVMLLLLICYYQHDFIVRSYRKQTMEDTLFEQRLKKDMSEKEYETKVQLQQNLLKSENQILEDRARLSQTLHDKLGHGINGSIYQLEAIKLLMEKDPEKARVMMQAVIDQLRISMDEIRAILRKERPEKKELALLQLYKLCEDCNQKGVETTLETEGEMSLVSEKAWEVLLDNAFEAVTNAMKYAKCKQISIKIVVLNQMIRCTITDDGKGCNEIKEGMGIAGM